MVGDTLDLEEVLGREIRAGLMVKCHEAGRPISRALVHSYHEPSTFHSKGLEIKEDIFISPSSLIKWRETGAASSSVRDCKRSVRQKKRMVLLEKLWDDVVAGPQPDRGLGKLRKLSTSKPTLNIKEIGESSGGKSMAMPASPGTPATPATPTTPGSARKENVWRSVFNPGSNLATKTIGGHYFDKPQPNSPTVYDWLYSDETRSKHR